jgi:hypothetical protein
MNSFHVLGYQKQLAFDLPANPALVLAAGSLVNAMAPGWSRGPPDVIDAANLGPPTQPVKKRRAEKHHDL